MKVLVTIFGTMCVVITAQPIVAVGVAIIAATGPVLPILGVLAAAAYVATCGNEEKE